MAEAKKKKNFPHGTLIKKCAEEMADAFGEMKLAEKFETVALTQQTMQRRIVALGKSLEVSLAKAVQECCYFSLCFDENRDETDVSQLIILA